MNIRSDLESGNERLERKQNGKDSHEAVHLIVV